MRRPQETDGRFLDLQLAVLNAAGRGRRIARILEKRPAFRIPFEDLEAVVDLTFGIYNDIARARTLRLELGEIDADGVVNETGPQTPDLGR